MPSPVLPAPEARRLRWSPSLQGSLTNLAKVAPAAGISWLVFEEAKMLMTGARQAPQRCSQLCWLANSSTPAMPN